MNQAPAPGGGERTEEMRTADVGQALAAVFGRDGPQREQHRLRTPACPPLWRFGRGNDALTEAEKDHVAECPYCRRLVGMTGEAS